MPIGTAFEFWMVADGEAIRTSGSMHFQLEVCYSDHVVPECESQSRGMRRPYYQRRLLYPAPGMWSMWNLHADPFAIGTMQPCMRYVCANWHMYGHCKGKIC